MLPHPKRRPKTPVAKDEFHKPCQSGRNRVASRANIFVSFFQKLYLYVGNPPHAEGRTRRHDTRVRAAMDVAAASDERMLLRTAKSCGPDTPTLVSALMRKHHALRWPKSPVHRGEHEVAVKPSRREGRLFGSPVVLPGAFCCTRTAGAVGTRPSLRPLDLQEGHRFEQLGQFLSRER
jgi:hypothetical protein